MRIWIVHVSLSLATGKAAVARQRGSRETVSGTIKLAGGLDLADLGWRSLYADRGGLRHLALRILVTGAASLGVAQLSLSGEESGGCFSKLFWKLEMRAMPGIREENKPGIRKLLLKDERIHGRDHDVVMTVHHESPVRDALQRTVALAGHLPPYLQRGQLGGGDLRRCGGFPIHLPRRDASKPCLARGLACGGR